MNVDMESGVEKLKIALFNFLVITMICLGVSSTSLLLGQGNKSILLPGIETELAKKQIPVDFGDTSKSLTPLLKKAFSVHGAFRLSHPKESQYTLFFQLKGGIKWKSAFLLGFLVDWSKK